MEKRKNRVAVITGCDQNHFWLAEDCIASLQAISDRAFDIGFISVGHTPLPPGLKNGVDVISAVEADSISLEPNEGFLLAALGLKARIPTLFPGYDVYIWMDADTWVQNAVGLQELIVGIEHADICISPQIDPHYTACIFPDDYTMSVYRGLFGEDTMNRYARRAMLNSGVFAARANSPLWPIWEALLAELRSKISSQPDRFFSDQIPLHYLIYSEALTFYPVRAVNNWLISHGTPGFSSKTGKLLVPSYPNEEINILHLLGPAKTQTFRYRDRDYRMTYSGMKQLSLALR